jgi:hypothetical protein
MHDFKIFFVISVSLLINVNLFGQNLSVKLQWAENIVIENEDFKGEVLSFRGADYTGEYLQIPVYSNSIDLPAGNVYSEFDLIIDNIRYKTCDKSENKVLENQQSGFSDNFRHSAEVYKARGKHRLLIRLVPFRKTDGGGFEKLISCDIQYKGVKQTENKRIKAYANNSVLANGNWYRIKISQNGVYRITYDQLREMGIGRPEDVRVFGNDAGMLSMRNDGTAPDDLLENDILYRDDAILFYAEGPDQWDFSETEKAFRHRDHLYSDGVYYYFSSDFDSGFDNVIQNAQAATSTPDYTVDYFHDYKRINEDKVNIAKTGRRFYGDLFDVTLSRNYRFDFLNLRTDKPVKLSVAVAAAAGSVSEFSISAGSFSGSISVAALASYYDARRSEKQFEFFPAQGNEIDLNLSYRQILPSWQGRLDYIELNAARRLEWTGGQMRFRNMDFYGSGTVSEFVVANIISNLQVWDITNPVKPKRVPVSESDAELRFRLSTDELREFVIFSTEDCLSLDPANAEPVENQNLHGLSPDVDLVIVTHPLFYSSALELKKMRENEGLQVFVCTPEKVYNEFSAGAPDISAIRNFMKMLYEKAANPADAVKYLLLFGDGSYDNTGNFAANTNYILTYQSVHSVGQTSSYFSDDYFGLLDEGEGDNGTSLTGLLDIGIGRIPVSTAGQAADYIKKLKRYANPETYNNWRNRLTFLADDEDGNAHIRDADTLTNYIDELYPWFNISKLYMDAYKQEIGTGGERYPEVNNEINNSVLKGTLLFNYTGHGGVRGLAHERVLTIRDIESWNNFDHLPLFVTATCEFTRFDDYDFLSAGERVFLNPRGGAIAMFTTARLAYIHSNAALTKAFYQFVFEPDDTDGRQMRLGDIIRLTKIERGGAAKDLIFFLLGDPSMRLGYAKHEIVTETINEQPLENFNDTIQALSKVKFSGRIENRDGALFENFSGLVYPTVFDKVQEVNTLNNDGHGVWTYNDRTNILFKGRSSVANGRFEFEFIVPRDIFLNIDTAKVSYYAADDYTTAKGSDRSFLVGGISENASDDSEGPEIKLFMNDENFVSGGSTDSNPILLAKFTDESGINTASGAIGHDITAVLDDNLQNTYFLNKDYLADTDTYKSGQLKHYLFDIEEGEHKIKLKAWDVFNNSSEAFLDFVVINTEDLIIKHLLNYPNPFTTATNFYFEHNRAFDRLDVLIQVFTPTGRPVKTIRETVNTQGYRAGPFFWDGTDDFGQRIGRGAYIYRVKVRSSDGNVQEEYQKLLILK